MTATEITIGIIALICISIAAMYLVQARERARIERVRRINGHQDRYRRMQRLLGELPPQYLSRDLRILVLQQAISSLQELSKLKPDPSVDKKLENDQNTLTDLLEKDVKLKPVAIKNEEHAKEARQLLEILFRFVETQQKQRKLSGAQTKKHLLEIKFQIGKSRADMFILQARKFEAGGKPRVAIHNYHNAITALSDAGNNPQAANLVAAYKAKIKELDKMADAEKKTAKEAHDKKLEANDEWNKFLKDDDDDWKIKNAYDDK